MTVCAVCLGSFQAARRPMGGGSSPKYCSQDCSRIGALNSAVIRRRKTATPTTCWTCHAEFTAILSSRAAYCGTPCKRIHDEAAKRVEGCQGPATAVSICLVCGGWFSASRNATTCQGECRRHMHNALSRVLRLGIDRESPVFDDLRQLLAVVLLIAGVRLRHRVDAPQILATDRRRLTE